MPKRKKLISVVSPAYNEEKNIPLMVREVKSVLKKISGKYDFEYILVDDGSQDKTWEKIIEENKKDKRIKGLKFSRNFGHQFALTAGFDYAKGDLVIYCDSDLQHPPKLFLKMITLWEKGYEVVHTIRTGTDKITFFKHIFSDGFYKVMRRLSSMEIEPGMADFKLLDRKVVDNLISLREHNRFLRGMVPWLGYRSASIEYRARARIHGKPWYNFRRSLVFARIGIMSFSVKPLTYIGYIGIFLIFVSFFLIVLDITLSIKTNHWILSPIFTLLLFNTLLIGVVLTCLGILALYLGVVYREVINRPLYLVSEKTKL